LQVKNLALYGKAVNGSGSGIYLMGEHDSANVSDSTKIEVTAEYDAFGIVIEASDTAKQFLVQLLLTLPLKQKTIIDVHGIKQFGAQTDYADLIINAQSDGADIFGISLVGHDGAGIVEVAGDLNIKA